MITRRNFMIAAAAIPLAKSLGAEKGGLPIVDTHQHLWDADKFNLPWIRRSKILNRSFLTSDYLEASKGLNVVKAVYMEVAVVPDQHLAEAEHVIELCKDKKTPTCAAVIGGRPGEEGFAAYIKRFKGSPYIRGVRRSPGARMDFMTKQFVSDIRLLGEMGMSFDICTSPRRLAESARLVDACPDTRFVVDHCGNADPRVIAKGGRDAELWKNAMALLAKKDNTICKISGIVARMERDKWSARDLAPVIDHCLDSFGPDRVVFGSDWPVCLRGATYKQWVEALKQVIAGRSEKDRKKLLHDNAVGFYRLSID